MKNRLSLLVLMLTFICLAASGQKNNNTPQSTTPTEISLQDSIQSLRADNADLRKQLDKMEKEVEKYRWDFGQTVNDYNDKMSLWLAIITILVAIVSVGGTYLTNKWSEKYIEKLLKSADEKAEIAQAKADKVVESVTADAKSAKEQAEKAEGFVNDAKKEAEKAEGLLSSAKEQADNSLAVINELKTQIVNELAPLKETANKSEALLNSIQEYFEKIKNNQVDNITDIGTEVKHSDNSIDTKKEKQKDQIITVEGVKYSEDMTTVLDVPKDIIHFIIPEGVTKIGKFAFWGCTSLTSIVIPDSVTEIGDGAFDGCTSISSIVIPKSVTEIGDYAFQDCTSLSSIEIPNSVTVIGGHAFYGCTSLSSIVIPKSVTEIGGSAFELCTGIKNYIVSNNNQKYCSIVGALYSKDKAKLIRVPCGRFNFNIPDSVTVIGRHAFYGCTSLSSIVIPDSVTEIGDGAFGYCFSLTSIEIPNGVTEIGMFAFENCSSITSIEIPNSVTEIGGSTFWGCSSLTSIEIPDSVTVIGASAFVGCYSLTEIHLKHTSPVDFSEAFDYFYRSKITLYVPKGSLKSYKDSGYYSGFNIEENQS